MKIFSPHRRKMEARRRYGSREFQNKIKKAKGYKRSFSHPSGTISGLLSVLRLNSKLVRVGLAAAVIALGYFLFVSDYFLVQNVQVSGTQRLDPAQISEALTGAHQRRLFVPANHLFLLSKARAYKTLAEEFPLVKEIASFKRLWPDRIELEVRERRPGFAFLVDSRHYLIDEEGVVVRPLPDASGLPLVIDQVQEQVAAGEPLNNARLVAFVLSLSKSWPGKVNSDLREMKVPGKAATQIQALSSEGWEVFFDTTRSAESQLENLALILNRQIPARSRLDLAYIDLRFDKWAYYCYKDSPCRADPSEPGQSEGGEIELPSESAADGPGASGKQPAGQ